jgi:hypothetical protein
MREYNRSQSFSSSSSRGGVASLLRTGVREVFVPQGLDEGSQAIYCLGCVQKKVTVPEGRCEPRCPMYWLPQVEERPVDPIIPSRDGSRVRTVPGNKLPGYHHSVPSGRRILGHRFRDNKPPLPVHIFESTSVCYGALQVQARPDDKSDM